MNVGQVGAMLAMAEEMGRKNDYTPARRGNVYGLMDELEQVQKGIDEKKKIIEEDARRIRRGKRTVTPFWDTTTQELIQEEVVKQEKAAARVKEIRMRHKEEKRMKDIEKGLVAFAESIIEEYNYCGGFVD